MNFIAAFVLEVSGLEEFESFNFIVNFWKKKKNLYFGIYAERFPMLKFLTFAFHYFLKLNQPKIEKALRKMDFLDELWIMKWFIGFFTFNLTKEYVLRIWDFLMINDCFGMVYVALAITEQLKKQILKHNMLFLTQCLKREKLSEILDFRKFVKRLKVLNYKQTFKNKILESYYSTLNQQAKTDFEFYYENLKNNFRESSTKYYNDFAANLTFTRDYDSITISNLEKNVKNSILLKEIKNEVDEIQQSIRNLKVNSTQVMIPHKSNKIIKLS